LELSHINSSCLIYAKNVHFASIFEKKVEKKIEYDALSPCFRAFSRIP